LHVFVQESNSEREAVNLGNVLISHEYFTVRKNETKSSSIIPARIKGKIVYLDSESSFYSNRGILNRTKLEKISYPVQGEEEIIKSYGLALVNPLLSPQNFDLGYPNSEVLFGIIDLGECRGEFCPGWIGSIKGPVNLEGLSLVRFSKCLADNIDISVGSIFRFFAYGIRGALWQPIDFYKCIELAYVKPIREFIFYTSGGGLNSRGLPILIKKGDEYSIGRLFVGVMKWL